MSAGLVTSCVSGGGCIGFRVYNSPIQPHHKPKPQKWINAHYKFLNHGRIIVLDFLLYVVVHLILSITLQLLQHLKFHFSHNITKMTIIISSTIFLSEQLRMCTDQLNNSQTTLDQLAEVNGMAGLSCLKCLSQQIKQIPMMALIDVHCPQPK